MDDQNKKDGYDDFFQSREEGEVKKEQHDAASGGENNPSAADTQAKPSYYYSYGPFKAGSQDEFASPPASSSSNSYYQASSSDDPSSSDRTYTQQSAFAQPAGQEPQGQASEPTNPFEVNTPPQLKPFRPNQQSAKGSWQVNEPRRRTSFKAMFASFLAGVLVVGTLMYTADTQNWFSGNAAATTTSQQTASGTAANGTAAQGNGGASVTAARPDNIASLFETASPAVVKIETYVKPSTRSSSSGSILDDPFFRQFFGEQAPQTQQQEESNSTDMQASGIGTGFFFESDGYILTNQHVIADSDKIEVTVQGYDKPLTAELLGSSEELDLAVLKVTSDKAFPTLPLGNSDNINIGDWVVAIGNPYGFDHTVTVGVLSAKERPIDIQDGQTTRNYEHLLQTDASINPGNSGGPLLNVNGEVIGINTAVSSQAQGIGFAIPTSTIQEVLDSLKNNVEVPKTPVPFIGAELGDVTADIAKQLGMDTAEGSIVSNVYYNSPAYLGDLKQFDVILGIDGKSYKSTQELISAIKAKQVGDKVELNIIRKGEKLNLAVEIGDKNKFNAE